MHVTYRHVTQSTAAVSRSARDILFLTREKSKRDPPENELVELSPNDVDKNSAIAISQIKSRRENFLGLNSQTKVWETTMKVEMVLNWGKIG